MAWHVRGLLTIGAVLMAGCASEPQRGPGGPNAERMMEPRVIAAPQGLLYVGLDGDQDGVTTRGEVESSLSGLFAQADLDQNSTIRPLELTAWLETFMGSSDVPNNARAFDRDLDGSISETEFSGYILHQFSRLDRNKDDVLQRNEIVETITPGARGGSQQRGGASRGGPAGRR